MILLTGGAGYIGTHTASVLAEANLDFIIYDNLSNSSLLAIERLEQIIGKKVKFFKGDIRDKKALQELFKSNSISSVIHFAGLKAVGESVKEPLKYYDNNVTGTINLLKVMQEFNCKKIVFSSSATVYGNPKTNPIDESFEVGNVTNPYGRSKLIIEQILNDLYISDNSWKIVMLRYFNPVGAHESGLIGEDPNDIPNNLMPYITQTAVGKLKALNVFGNDYNTKDGTGVRDYIHVMDLALGHLRAIEKIDSFKEPTAINLGTGRGYSVLEVIRAFEKASNQKINYKIAPRRAGDIATCYANPALAKELLDWVATRDIEQMCKDAWNWQVKNPNGYKKD